MRIVINHLTRMKPPYICVAGLLEDGSAHVRPVAGHLPRTLVASNGGPFDIGAVVDLGQVRHTPTRPEIEDHGFNPQSAGRVDYLPTADLWRLLTRLSRGTLEDIFGPDLKLQNTWRGAGAAISPGQGVASLGVLRPGGPISLQIEASYADKGKELRVIVRDKLGNLNLSVTDLRFYQDENYAINEGLVTAVQAKLEREEDVLLSVGLTRKFARRGDIPRHWLQVNNIFPNRDPAWRPY
jgi:hypothetical protein